MKTIVIYSLSNFQVYHTTVLIIFIILYITFYLFILQM